jgi:multisubunit Na+/H+ antiporter MnhG subunit
VGLALIATLLAIWFKISTALTEIVVGTVAQFVIVAFIGHGVLGAKAGWVTFLAGAGAVVLTFLAGAELDPVIFRTKWKEATVVGLVGFFGPFLGCAAIAHYVLHWAARPSWLAGVALSTTSVAVVAVARSAHMEDAGFVAPLAPDRADKLAMKNFDPETAQRFAKLVAEDRKLHADNLDDFLTRLVEFSEGNPGAIASMIDMATMSKYRLEDQIIVSPLYIDFRLRCAAAASE